jgi:hypothetical protein
VKIFNRTRAGEDARRRQDLLAYGFEILRGPDGPQTPTTRILSGPEVPMMPHDQPLPLRTRYIEVLQEGDYWTLAIDGAELLQHAGRAACLRMLELITAPEADRIGDAATEHEFRG